MATKARIIHQEYVYDGFFKMQAYDFWVPFQTQEGGQELHRLVFERGHAVAVLPYDPVTKEVLLVREFRSGMMAAGDDPFSDALVAGMIDAGEAASDAALREMVEETGQKAAMLEEIHAGAYVSPGGTSERIALYYAEMDLSQAGGTHGEVNEGEDILSVKYDVHEFVTQCVSGQISDMKTVLAGIWLARKLGL